MRASSTPVRLLAGAFLISLAATGCSSDEAPESPAPEEKQGNYDGAEGDSTRPRADKIEGAELVEGEFNLTEGNPEENKKISGTAWLAQHDDGTTMTVEFSGLPKKTEFMAQLHEKSCQDGYGGDHFKFDADGEDKPPNVLQLLYESDGEGKALSTIDNDEKTGDSGRSVLVHQGDAMVACANLS